MRSSKSRCTGEVLSLSMPPILKPLAGRGYRFCPWQIFHGQTERGGGNIYLQHFYI
jgi:hypothetical protein